MRLTDSCITQIQAQGPSRTCNESKEEEAPLAFAAALREAAAAVYYERGTPVAPDAALPVWQLAFACVPPPHTCQKIVQVIGCPYMGTSLIRNRPRPPRTATGA